MIRTRLLLLVLGTVLAWLCPARAALADEVAPELEGADLRIMAQAELKRLASTMDVRDRRKLAGLYVAFDPSESDPVAQVACDDDGDYVVLLSGAMLRLLTHVARAASYDEENASRKIEEYAGFVARSQVPGRRLLPPPPGFYVAENPTASCDERFVEALAFVLARELAHLRAGDLVCPRPTVTKESGDDVWTSVEQRRAVEQAKAVYPGRQLERDAEATARVRSSGRTERGALALLRFFAQLERGAAGRFSPSYLARHPSPALRADTVKRAAEAATSD